MRVASSAGRLLIIEDDDQSRGLICIALLAHHFDVDATGSGVEGELKAMSGEYDAIILDLMLQDHHGVDICRSLRRQNVTTPILILSGLAESTDRVTGLKAGADDYLIKPFDPEELVARVRAIGRRKPPANRMVVKAADVELDVEQRRVTRGLNAIALTDRELKLLEVFLRNPDTVLSRELLGERVWEMTFADGSNVVDVYVGRVRSKLNATGAPLIHSTEGGFIFSANTAFPFSHSA